MGRRPYYSVMSTTRGRRRDPRADRAILDATLSLIGEVGFTALSMEGIAARAGVGKSTVYRRYSSKEAIVAAAMGVLAHDPELPDSGDLYEDLVEFVTSKWTAMTEPPGATLLGTFIVQASSHPALFDEFRRAMLVPRLAPLETLLQRGIERGELDPGLDVAVAIDLIVGPMLVGLLTGSASDPAGVRERLAVVWAALQAVDTPD